MNKIDLIIRTKTYGELTSDDKNLLAELVTDEASFQQLKLLYQISDRQQQAKKVVPQKNTKAALDALYLKKHSHTQHNWQKSETKIIPFQQKNWVKVAAVLLIGIGFSAYLLVKPSTFEKQKQVAQLAPTKKVKKQDKDESILNVSQQPTLSKKESKLVATADQEASPMLLAGSLPMDIQKDTIDFSAIPMYLAEYKRQDENLDDAPLYVIEKDAVTSGVDAQKMQVKVIPLANLLVYAVPAF
jgi:hypothetical protein